LGAKEVKIPTMQEEVYRLADEYEVNPELAIAIISCEGARYKTLGNNQNHKNGVWWSEDIGYFQVNDYFHLKTATKMGLDIYDDTDNLEYGIWLLKTQGVRHWKASAKCWQKLI